MVSQYQVSLARPMNAGDNTTNELYVTSIITSDGNSHTLTMADFPFGVGYVVVDPGGNFEIIKFTGIDASAIGFTGIASNRGLPTYFSGGETSITSNILAHSAGVDVIITDNVNWWLDHYVDTSTAQTVAGIKTFSSSPIVPDPTTGTQVANKEYVDAAVSGGVGTASPTVFGTTKISVNPAIINDPIAVGQNDPVLTTLSGTKSSAGNQLVDFDSIATTSTNNAVVRSNASGKIDSSFLSTFGGTGADGALNVTSGTTTIALGSAAVVVKNYTSINVSLGATLNFSGAASGGTTVILKSQGNVTFAGTVDETGMGNQNPGAGGTVPGGAGGNGGSGNNILDTLTTHGGQAATGGLQYNFSVFYHTQNWKSLFLAPGSAGGGGGGGTNGTGSGAVGGAGGKGAGSLYVECGGTYNASGTITTAGTAGVNGTNQSGGGNGGGGGGGGGGAAGDIYVIYSSLGTDTATYIVTGGAGGTGGSGSNLNGASGGVGGGGGANSDNAGGAGSSQSAGVGGNGATGAAGLAIRELNVAF